MSRDDDAAALRIFDALLQLPASDRANYFDAISASTPASVLQRVRSMLEHLTSTSGEKLRLCSSTIDDWLGRRLGKYVLLRRIGKGGMGIVYKAQRHDRYEQRVAIKVLRPELLAWSNEFLARFQAEGQLLAKLRHPNIVTILDAGVWEEENLPYLVMEYLDGALAILEYCRRRQTPLSERIRLFRLAAEAIAHAHSIGISHRDIKSENILVTPEGEVKVTDFGLGLDADPNSLGAAGQTVAKAMATPSNASPERLRGGGHEDVAAQLRDDVFAIGLVMLELCDAPPSSTQSGAPRRRLDRWLDQWRSREKQLHAIAKHAVAKEPLHRYPSAIEMMGDLQRWNQRRPVSVYSQSRCYRLRCFAGRHQRLTIAVHALVVVAVLSVALGLAIRYSGRQQALVEWRTHLSTINRATQAVSSGYPRSASELLERTPSHFRGLEWRTLHNRIDDSITNFSFTAPPRAIAISPDARLVAFVPDDRPNALLMHDALAQRTLVLTADLPEAITCVQFSADSGQVIACVAGQTWVVDVKQATVVKTISIPGGPWSHCALSPDGGTLVTGSAAGLARAWDVATGNLLGEHQCESGAISALVMNPQDSKVAILCRTSHSVLDVAGPSLWVQILRLPMLDQEITYTLSPEDKMVTDLAWDAGTNRVLKLAQDGHLDAFAAGAAAVPVCQSPFDAASLRVGVGPPGSRVALFASNDALAIVDIESGQCEQRCYGMIGKPVAVRVSRDGSLVCGAGNCGVAWWCRERATADSLQNQGLAEIAVDGDGKLAVMGGYYGSLFLVNVDTRQVLRVLQRWGEPAICSVAFDTSGQRVFACTSTEVLAWSTHDLDAPPARHSLRGGSGAAIAANENTVMVSVFSPNEVPRIDLLDAQSLAPSGSVSLAPLKDVRRLFLDATGRLLCCVDEYNGAAKMIDVDKRQLLGGVVVPGAQLRMAVAVGDTSAIAVADSGRVMSWNYESGQVLSTHETGWGAGTAAWIAKERKVLIGNTDAIGLFDEQRPECVQVVNPMVERVLSYGVSRDGDVIVSSGYRGRMYIRTAPPWHGRMAEYSQWRSTDAAGHSLFESVATTSGNYDEACSAIEAKPGVSPPVVARAKILAALTLDEPTWLNQEAWEACLTPNREPSVVQVALRRAERACEMTDQCWGGNWPYQNTRALVLIRAGRPGEAINALKQGLARVPVHPADLTVWALALASSGECREAKEVVGKVESAVGSDPAIDGAVKALLKETNVMIRTKLGR